MRSRRKELADVAGVPPYVVFSDRALQEMATYFPHSALSFGLMHGVGESKVAQYAETFLPIIREHCQQQGLSEVRKSRQAASSPRPRTSLSKPRYEQIAEEFIAGQSFAAIMETQSIKRSTLMGYLNDYLLAGQPLPVERLEAECTLPVAKQAEVFAVLAELGPERLRPIYDALHETVSFDELHLLRMIDRLKQ